MADTLMAIGNKISDRTGRLLVRRPHETNQLNAQIANGRESFRQANRNGIDAPDDIASVTVTAGEVRDAGQVPGALKTRFQYAYSLLQNIAEPTDRARRPMTCGPVRRTARVTRNRRARPTWAIERPAEPLLHKREPIRSGARLTAVAAR